MNGKEFFVRKMNGKARYVQNVKERSAQPLNTIDTFGLCVPFRNFKVSLPVYLLHNSNTDIFGLHAIVGNFKVSHPEYL